MKTGPGAFQFLSVKQFLMSMSIAAVLVICYAFTDVFSMGFKDFKKT